ncbi:MAG: sensor histidine kinase [Trebonia sp.]
MDGVVPVARPDVGPVEPSAPDGTWGGTMTPAQGPPVLSSDREALRRGARQVLLAPITRRCLMDRWYAGLSFLLAVPCFLFVVVAVILGLGLSFSFAGMLAGVPLLVLSLLAARRLAGVSRGLAGRLLGVRVAAPPPPARGQGVVGWARAGLTDPVAWRACAYLVLKLPVALIAVVVAGFLWVYGVPYLTFPLWWPAVHGAAIHIPAWLSWWTANPVRVAQAVRTWPAALALVPVGAFVLLVTPWLTRAVNGWDAALIARLLGPASLPQRVRELEQTRARAVDDSAARLRRIERDLHDGAQAQMVAVAMKLGLAKIKLGGAADGPAPGADTGPVDLERVRDLVNAAHRSAKEAISELRELAHGIHPAVLDQGLSAALATLAADSAVPVELNADLSARPSPAIETIAYFCVAELLANMAKHSGARHVTLEAVHGRELLLVRVTDDGAGGARIAPGGGLAGLADRVSTVDGTMEITSPPGGPTVVTVRLPSHA